MTRSSPHLAVQRIAREADRARRRQRASRLLVRIAPAAAGVACAIAVAAVFAGGPRLLGVGALVAAALSAVAVHRFVRRDRPVADDDVRDLDAAARLDGSLRSAHWFASDTSATAAVGGRPDAAWIAFHLGSAAARAEGVDWSAVYPPPTVRRSGVATAVLALGVVVLAAWPQPIRATLRVARTGEGASTREPVIAIPSALMPQLIEGMRAMKAGRPPSKEALAAIGQALEIAKQDETLRDQLDKLFDQAGEFADDPALFDQSREGYELRAQAEQGYGMDPSLQWAYQEAAAKASADRQADKQTSTDPAAGGESSDGAAGENAEKEAGLGTPSASAEMGQGQSQPATFSSLLFGKQPGGDGKASPTAAPSNMAALMAALRREVINAQRDVEGASGGQGERRATNATSGRPNAVTGTIDTTYDVSRATRPPAVPDARRPLVHDFFTRPAETGATGTRP